MQTVAGLKQRRDYLERLLAWDREDALAATVRLITGVRRCGKSSLLQLHREAVGSDRVLAINFESLANQRLTDPAAFAGFVLSQRATHGYTHLHVDEVQELGQWAKVINGLRVDTDLTITATGSNASVFAGEGLTYLAGRYIQLEMFPLSLGEYRDFVGASEPGEQLYAAWLRGTLPAVATTADPATRTALNNAVFDSIFTRDIAMRGAIQDTEVFLRVARFLFDNAGSLVSINKVASTLVSAGHKVSHHTIDKYVRLMVDAHMFYPCRRYDVRGKEYLRGGGKYYFVDPGLRDAFLGSRAGNLGHDLENMVYLELRRRGYDVCVGKTPRGEVDFVCRVADGSEVYVQVALTALDEATLARELAAFDGVPTGARCVLLTFDRLPLATGSVVHIHATDFLEGREL